MAADDEDDLLVRQIQRIALANVTLGAKAPDAPEAWLRSVFRWYSREFHTPLHVVPELPMEDILLHYYECLYDQYEDIEIDAEKVRLTETAEERQQRAIAAVREAEDVDQLVERIQKREAQKAQEAQEKRKAPQVAPERTAPGSGRRMPQVSIPRTPPKDETVLRMDFADLADDSMPGASKKP